MGRKLFILVAVMSFALIGSSFAAVENIKVSGDITEQAVTRDLNLSNGATLGSPGDEENYFISQVRIRFDADLTENVSAAVRLLNETQWGWDDGFEDDNSIILDLSYIELREFLYQPFTLIVGRQELRYGNALIVGDRDTNQCVNEPYEGGGFILSRYNFGDLSLRKSFDAIRGIIDYSPYTIDFVYAKIDEGDVTGSVADDTTLAGVNVAYDWASYNGITEAYLWYADNGRNALNQTFTNVRVNDDHSKTFAVGGRFQFDPNDNVTLGLEGAYEFGDAYLRANATNTLPGQKHLSAFAGQFLGEYRFLNKYNTKLNLTYSYLSGNDDYIASGQKDWNGWDPMFEDQVPGEILNILFAQTNCHVATIEGSMMPREDVTLGLKYIFAKLAQNIDGTTYSPAYGPASLFTYQIDRDNTYLGSEVDTYAIYDYTEDVQIKLITAAFFPGDFFTSANDSVAYSVRGSLSVNF